METFVSAVASVRRLGNAPPLARFVGASRDRHAFSLDAVERKLVSRGCLGVYAIVIALHAHGQANSASRIFLCASLALVQIDAVAVRLHVAETITGFVYTHSRVVVHDMKRDMP